MWEDFRIQPSEWRTMEKLCEVLQTAESVSLDVQRVTSSIADSLFFHRILKRALDSRLQDLHDVDESSPAFGMKKAIYAIESRLEKYERRSQANKMIITASLLLPKRRMRFFAQPPDGETAAALLSSMVDRFVGKEFVAPGPKPLTEHFTTRRYGVDLDSDEETTSQPTSETDVYLSERYPSDSNLADTTEGALLWWRQHEQYLPRLARLARTLLAVPATASISEGGFGYPGVFCGRRRNLGAESIPQLTACKLLVERGFDPYLTNESFIDNEARDWQATLTTASTSGPSISHVT